MIYSVFSLKIPYYGLFYFGENSLVNPHWHFMFLFYKIFWKVSVVVRLICSQKSMNLNALDFFVLSNISKYANKTPFLWILWCVEYFGVIYCVVFITIYVTAKAVDVSRSMAGYFCASNLFLKSLYILEYIRLNHQIYKSSNM